MPNSKIKAKPLQEVADSVHKLDQISEQLLYGMEEQIQAIISSKPGLIEELSEKQNSMQGKYKRLEKTFVENLKNCLKQKPEDDKPVMLTNLKEIYPDEADKIDHWKFLLRQNGKRLQKKHEQLMELLEFALNRNAHMMHSVYSLFNSKNSLYKPDGGKSDVSSGMAVNQEV